MAQPNPGVVLTQLQNIGTSVQDLAHEASLMPNIPAINQGTQLLHQIQQLQTQMLQFQREDPRPSARTSK